MFTLYTLSYIDAKNIITSNHYKIIVKYSFNKMSFYFTNKARPVAVQDFPDGGANS